MKRWWRSSLFDGTYDEEVAVWIEDSGNDDDDEEEEEAEVEEELLAGLFDDSILSSYDDDAAVELPADDTFDLSEVLLDFYGPNGSKDDLLVNVVPPDFDSADVLDVHNDFDHVLEDLFVPKWSVPGLFEDGSPPPRPVPAEDDPAVVDDVKYDVPTPDFAVELPNGADDTFDLSKVLLDFYGPNGSKAELLVNVVPPDFEAADVLNVCEDFGPVFADLLISKRSAGLLEDGLLYCPSSSSVPTQDDIPPLTVVQPVECEVPAPDISSAVHANASYLIGVVVDGLQNPTLDPLQALRHPCLDLTLDPSACVPMSYSLSPLENGIEKVLSDVRPEGVNSENALSKTGLCTHESVASIDLANANANGNDDERMRLWQQVTQEVHDIQKKVRYVYLVSYNRSHLITLLSGEPMAASSGIITFSSVPSEQNEFQRMRAKLRCPPNMTEQNKRLRRVWDLHGTEKSRALKEQHLQKAER
jgi:hypothetical protein